MKEVTLFEKVGTVGLNLAFPWLGSLVTAYKVRSALEESKNFHKDGKLNKIKKYYYPQYRNSALLTTASTLSLGVLMGLSFSNTIDVGLLNQIFTLDKWDGLYSDHSLSSISGVPHLDGIVIVSVLLFVILPMLLRAFSALLRSDERMSASDVAAYGIFGEGTRYFKAVKKDNKKDDLSDLSSSVATDGSGYRSRSVSRAAKGSISEFHLGGQQTARSASQSGFWGGDDNYDHHSAHDDEHEVNAAPISDYLSR